MLTDEQLIQRVRASLEHETAGLDPSPDLLAIVQRELRETPGRPERRRWRTPSGGVTLVAIATAIAVAVAVFALTLGGPRRSLPPTLTTDAVGAQPAPRTRLPLGTPAGPATANPNTFQGAAIPSSVRLVAETPDPSGGLPWGLREFQTTRDQTCLQIGRVQASTIGVIGQDDAWANDHHFHPISPNAYTGDSCSPTDGHGAAFNNVSVQGGIASADVPWGTGRQSGECRTGGEPRQFPVCPPGDLRDLDYGLLGPQATSITYLSPSRQLLSEPTNGPDGAYLIVRPGTSGQSCSKLPGGGQACASGGGRTAGAALSSGVITVVTYRNGRTCHLPAPTSAGPTQASCPAVGYTPPRAAKVTAAGRDG